MRRTNFGKIHPLLAIVLVVATLAASAGAGILYQYINGNKLELGPTDEPEEEEVAPDGPRRLSIPPLGSGVAGNTRPERTKPFKYVHSDRASTTSESGAADPNPKYSDVALSAEEFNLGYQNFMLQAIDHFRSANADKEINTVDETAALLSAIIKTGDDGDLKQFRKPLESLLLDPAVSRDPLFQYLAGVVHANTDDSKSADTLFNGAIVDFRKWDYPSRYVIPVYNERLKNGLNKRANPDGYEAHADALVGWLQYDFSETPNEQCFCWKIIGNSIELLAKEAQLDQVKKIIDKNAEQKFVSPWLAEMIVAHYHLQLALADQDVDENLNQSKQHLEAAIKINPAFTVAQTDLQAVEDQIKASKAE